MTPNREGRVEEPKKQGRAMYCRELYGESVQICTKGSVSEMDPTIIH